MAGEGGHDSVSWCGERDGDGEAVREEFGLELLSPRLRARFERQKEEDTRMSFDVRDEFVRLLPVGRVAFDEPMKSHCTMGAGGPAEAFVIVDTVEELKRVMNFAALRNVDCMFWGGGSNTLVRDKGVRGIVVKLGDGFNTIEVLQASGEDVLVVAGASVPTARLLEFCREKGFSGLEKLTGVCGTVGGNLLTNAGTSGWQIAEAVSEATIVNRELRELTLKRQALRFEYRSLKLPRTAAVTRVVFTLKAGTSEEVSARMKEISERRRKTQPHGVRSLGCIFRNTGKTPAGLLIDEAGLKGVRIGGARVSAVHANFIVNEGNATAHDVIVLMNLVRDRVREDTGITLESEIEVVGDK